MSKQDEIDDIIDDILKKLKGKKLTKKQKESAELAAIFLKQFSRVKEDKLDLFFSKFLDVVTLKKHLEGLDTKYVDIRTLDHLKVLPPLESNTLSDGSK